VSTQDFTINRRILVIDDSEAIHQDFLKILGAGAVDPDLAASEAALFGDALPETSEFELAFAHQGQEGLAKVEQAIAEGRPYAMAFVDMRMPPGWDGVETIERLWQTDPQLQVALCTAYSDYSWEAISARLELGDRFLILKKPFDTIEIRQMASALTAKWQATRDTTSKLAGLEHAIEERTGELLKLSRMVQYDALTELPNGLLFHELLNQSLALSERHHKQLAVVLVGLDRFQRINSSLGHPMGNEVLKAVAKRLIDAVRKSDPVIRMSDDKFALLMADVTHPEQTITIAEKLLSALRQPHRIAGNELSVTASLGVSVYPENGSDSETLLNRAQIAMHDAKESGRDGVRFFTMDMNHRARARQVMEVNLRRALEENEFILHYQPKLDLRSKAIAGAEALIRWQQPDGELILPAHFIPVAEDCGLIVSISRWVLREACRQARAWQNMGLPIYSIAVNVSALDFRRKEFVENVRMALEDSRLEPGHLELEITEGVLMQNVEATAVAIQSLKEMGVRLAIDDFGTGYSSLSYLRKFPVDVLKIDQSFVRDINTDASDAAIVSAIIAMGKSLDLRVVAEGVETLGQLEFLQAHNCDEGQGFFFSRGLAADEFARLLGNQPTPSTYAQKTP
jgi:diguanylate cyclase (GGDEF)-like protein